MKLLGATIISLPFITKFASANLYLRTSDGTKIDFDDIIRTSTAVKTSDYSMINTDYLILIDATSNTVTITLPSATENNSKVFNIKCIQDDYECNISTIGGQEIDTSSNDFQIFFRSKNKVHGPVQKEN